MVKIDPDEVYEVAQSTIDFAETLETSEPLKKAKVTDATFGDIDFTADFVMVHGQAQQVVQATLKGVKEDLNKFGTGLKKSVETLRLLEDVTVVTFQALNPFMPLAADPNTGLDPNSLANIADIDGIGQADTEREQAINNAGGSDNA